MEINYALVGIAAVLSLVVGSIWYGPLFGKKWLLVIGATDLDIERRNEMQRKAMPLYVLQFVLSLLQIYILAHFIKGWSDVSGIENALWLWLGFVMPTVAGSAMWNNSPSRVKWTMFLIQAGYQLVMFVIYGYVFGRWG